MPEEVMANARTMFAQKNLPLKLMYVLNTNQCPMPEYCVGVVSPGFPTPIRTCSPGGSWQLVGGHLGVA